MKDGQNNLSNLIIEVDELDFNKLVPDPVDLSKLSDVVTNNAVKNDVYNTITTLNAIINEVKGKIPSITSLVTTVAPHTKTNELKSIVANITNLASTSSLTATEKKP